MIFIYDILVNWTDSKRIYDFYEWNNKDRVDNLKRIPLFRISTNNLAKIINNDFIINKDFLEKIKNLTTYYQGKKVLSLAYATLFTDNNTVLAFEFNEQGYCINKSKLVLEEEDEILNTSDNLDIIDLNITNLKPCQSNPFLTRKEIYIKKFLNNEIKKAYQSNNLDKLKYLYQEYNPKEIKEGNIYHELLSDLENNFNDRHIKLYELLRGVNN